MLLQMNPILLLKYLLSAGFLSTGDSNAPGNYALLDQVAALHWIRENIRAFGGDPGEISLLGQGYGAAMVNLLMVSPVTRGV
jgi:carboxylesterase type B